MSTDTPQAFIDPGGRLRLAPKAATESRRHPVATATPQFWLAHVGTCGVCKERGVKDEGWACGSAAPPSPGQYERLYTDGTYRHWWTGEHWASVENGRPHWRQVGDYPCWRPIGSSPSPPTG